MSDRGWKPRNNDDFIDEKELISPKRRRKVSVDSMAGVDLRAIDFGGRVDTCPCSRTRYYHFDDEDEIGGGINMVSSVTPSSFVGKAMFCGKRFFKPPVLFFNVVIISDVTLLFGFNANIITRRLPTYSVFLIMGIVYTLLMLYWSWYMILFTPSTVEANPPPRGLDTVLMRRCGKCVAIRPNRPHLGLKPFRAHHCRFCDRCVLKMDHHCIFLAQCIGHFNYKFFCLFVVYAILGCAFYVAVSLPVSAILGPYAFVTWYNLLPILTAASVLATFVLLVTLVIFWSTHVKLILNCQTTIEYIKSQSLDHGEPVMIKLRRIFGDELWTWFFPIGRPKESGYEWDDPSLTSRAEQRVDI